MARRGGVRRIGSAALDLAWVAAGRFDGFWERDLRPGTSPPASSWCARPAAMSPTPTARTRMLETGSVVAGNEAIQRRPARIAEGLPVDPQVATSAASSEP